MINPDVNTEIRNQKTKTVIRHAPTRHPTARPITAHVRRWPLGSRMPVHTTCIAGAYGDIGDRTYGSYY